MVIVNYRAGQLANRLFHFSHFIANSKSLGYTLVYPFFKEYKEFFEFDDEMFENGRISLDYTSNSFLNKSIHRVIKFLAKRGKYECFFWELYDIAKHDREGLNFNMRNPDFAAKAKSKLLLTSGWLFRDEDSFDRYAKELRKIFTPKAAYRLLVQNEISELRDKGGIIVGILLQTFMAWQVVITS